jgi:hypothetical protein
VIVNVAFEERKGQKSLVLGLFSALQKASRRLFWCFLRHEKLPDDRFSVFYAAKSFPTTVLVFSAS